MGEISGRGSDFDELPVSSVVYMGRGSFRMEAVHTPEPVATGVVQPIAGAVTAPLHGEPRAGANGNERVGAAHPRSLFGSQIDVPLLAAPMGSAAFHAPVVSLSGAALGALCGAVLLSGIVVGTAARHLFASPAPTAVVAASAVVATTPVAAPAVAATTPAAPISPVAETLRSSRTPDVSVPAPATIRARTKAPAKPAAAPARKAADPPAPKPWVDPWAS
jgi:hypothetical protein